MKQGKQGSKTPTHVVGYNRIENTDCEGWEILCTWSRTGWL